MQQTWRTTNARHDSAPALAGAGYPANDRNGTRAPRAPARCGKS